MTEEFNPYQAPETSAGTQQMLSADAEFLVSDRCILCGPVVQLPKICIRSGETSDLIMKTGTLKWKSMMPIGIGALTTVVAMIIGSLTGVALSWLSLVLIYAVWGAVFLVRNLLPWNVREVQATWFVSTREEQQWHSSRVRRLWVAGIAGALVAGVVIIAWLTESRDVLSLINLPLLVAVLALLSIPKANQPELTGVHQDLNILRNLSPVFLKKVLRLIKRHDETPGEAGR
ncbi:MAG: hypothetical protein R3C49_12155 [Planctomycetaceae bacterium]